MKKLFIKNTILKVFEKPKFFEGDNFIKIYKIYSDKAAKNQIASKAGTFKKNQKYITINCFKYQAFLIN